MAFQLSDGTGIPIDVPFTIGTTNYPANWLRLSTAEEKTAVGIIEVADPKVYNSTFYYTDGTEKTLEDTDSKDDDGNLIKNADGSQNITYGLKTNLKNFEKQKAATLLSKYDWYVTRKLEKDIAIPTEVSTYRDAVRSACNTRESEISGCSDMAALINLYGSTEQSDGTFKPNMTEYPNDPYEQIL